MVPDYFLIVLLMQHLLSVFVFVCQEPDRFCQHVAVLPISQMRSVRDRHEHTDPRNIVDRHFEVAVYMSHLNGSPLLAASIRVYICPTILRSITATILRQRTQTRCNIVCIVVSCLIHVRIGVRTIHTCAPFVFQFKVPFDLLIHNCLHCLCDEFAAGKVLNLVLFQYASSRKRAKECRKSNWQRLLNICPHCTILTNHFFCILIHIFFHERTILFDVVFGQHVQLAYNIINLLQIVWVWHHYCSPINFLIFVLVHAIPRHHPYSLAFHVPCLYFLGNDEKPAKENHTTAINLALHRLLACEQLQSWRFWSIIVVSTLPLVADRGVLLVCFDCFQQYLFKFCISHQFAVIIM